MKIRYVLLIILMYAGQVFSAQEEELQIVKVTDNVWALVGPLNNRTAENLANNATFGVVVTDDGVVLVDPGGSYKGAQRIHEKIKTLTNKPVKYVINSGGQDHRWFGNSYFKKLGATIISSKAAKKDQAVRARDQWISVEAMIGSNNITGTKEQYADVTFDEEYKFALGKENFELYYRGQAHTPGDIFIWLPQQKVMFSGDIVYTERMLGIGSQSNSKSWIEVYKAMAAFEPRYIVPGHGQPATLAKTRQDTYNYLVSLRAAVAKFIEEGGDISDIGKLNQSAFNYLVNFDSLKGRNAQQVFTEMEWE